MLSDDITGTISSGISKTKAVLSGAVRGLLIGAAIALAVVLIPPAIGAIGAFFGSMATAGGLSALGTGTAWSAAGTAAAASFAHVTLAGIGAALALGAKIGGAVLGVASIIPGANKGFGLKGSGHGLLRKRPDPEPMPNLTPEVGKSAAPERPPVEHDNHLFVEGAGTRMMNRGDANSVATTCHR